jgi:nicotinate phosphoribosyltransferase
LIEPVVRAGKRVARAPALAEFRARAARELARLPLPLKRLEPEYEYPTTVSPALKALAAEADRKTSSTR